MSLDFLCTALLDVWFAAKRLHINNSIVISRPADVRAPLRIPDDVGVSPEEPMRLRVEGEIQDQQLKLYVAINSIDAVGSRCLLAAFVLCLGYGDAITRGIIEGLIALIPVKVKQC